jgi:hypothetical protein
MILKINGEKLIEIDIGPNNDEDQFIELNPEYIKIDDLPYSESGVYKYAEDGVTIIPSVEDELEKYKTIKMEEVLMRFDDMMFNGTFMTSFGFEADNRRGNGKNDKDNVQSLIDLGQEPVYFRDAVGSFHALTIQDLMTLKQEMIQDGLSKYQWKWSKENEIMTASTLEDLNNIEI